MTDKRFGALILAAGFSSRMGKFKPLLSLGDELVIERVLKVSKSVRIKDIVVVTGYKKEALVPIIRRQGAREAFNPDFEKGMFTSIQAGAAAMPSDLDGFFIMPVDCPLMTGAVLEGLIGQFEEDRFCVPCYRGKKGHPLLVPITYREEIICHDGTNGLKAITDRDPEKMKRIEVDDEGVVMDMDTPQAYEEIKAYLSRGCRSESLTALAAGRRFFLIRHGQIRQHKEKIFLGQTDVPLSGEGRQQAAAAAEKLASIPLQTDRIYASDLLRASESAQIIAQHIGEKKLIMEPGLREMNLGPWDGKFISQIKQEYPEEYQRRGRDLMTYKMGNGSENFFDLQYRVVKTLIKILKEDQNRDLILVAHSGVLRAVSNNLRGKDIAEPWDKLGNGQMETIDRI